MSTITLEVAGKSKTGKGIVGKDKVWYNTGKNVSFADIVKGDIVELNYTEANETRFVQSFSKVNDGKVPIKSSIPSVPSLPKTTVTETAAPMGTPPITPAKKKTVDDTDKMSKQDWLNKDISIERVAVIKSVLESMAYGQLSVGKREQEVLEIGGRMVDYFVAKLDSLKGK